MPRALLVVSLCVAALAVVSAQPVAARSMRDEPTAERGLLNRIAPGASRAGRLLSRALEAQMREADRGGSFELVGLAAVALLCGVVLTAGPGHGKIVIASVFLTGDIGWKRAVAMMGLVSVLQVAAALAAVVVLGPVLAPGRAGAVRAATAIEIASYGIAALAGAVGFGLALIGGPPAVPGRGARGRRIPRWAMLLALGSIPSAGAMNLGLAAVASGTLVAGAVAALGIAAGATVTLAVIAMIGIGARVGLVRVPWIGPASQRSRIVAAIGWLVATAASAAFLWGSWTRLR